MRPGTNDHDNHDHMSFTIHTKTERAIHAKHWNTGSDGFVHAKNGSTTVASIPVGNVDSIVRRGSA